MICLNNVSFHYDGDGGRRIAALDGCSLTIHPGEYCSIIGANGSGKSTLARHLNALLLPSSGEVTIDGLSTKDATKTWEIRRLVGMVFQNPDNQLIATTVEEDVALVLKTSVWSRLRFEGVLIQFWRWLDFTSIGEQNLPFCQAGRNSDWQSQEF